MYIIVINVINVYHYKIIKHKLTLGNLFISFLFCFAKFQIFRKKKLL